MIETSELGAFWPGSHKIKIKVAKIIFPPLTRLIVGQSDGGELV